jgi:TPP-dependent 2-oxoacid decarboxylase
LTRRHIIVIINNHSYVIEQKIKGQIYLYEVESYWDSEKKQADSGGNTLGRRERMERR